MTLALLTVVAVVSLHLAEASPVAAQATSLANLAVAPGYQVEVDAVGFDLPTAIAFIPNPGDAPDSPLYFVAELQGAIKVVTRDRHVHVFARVPTWGKQGHDLDGASQQGLAGLCLAADEGYLFATYTEPDAGGVMRNRIVRFTATPDVYDLAASSAAALVPVLATVQSAPAHQIGGCVVHDGQVFVGIGDGGNPGAVADPAVPLGKIICFNLDGLPCSGHAFDGAGAEPYVHAVGFRNPFGLTFVGGELKAIENGVRLDRFLTVRAGRDHLWDGTDESISSLADVIFPRSFAPVQLAYVAAATPFMDPAWVGHFLAAGFGSKNVPSGVALFGGEARDNRAATPPRYLLEYLGPAGTQHFTGVAQGPDGIYVVPMLPIAGTSGAVLKVSYDPAAAHAVVVKTSGLFRSDELPHLTELGCVSCHNVAGQGGDIGPNLDRFAVEWRITEYLASDEYEALVTAQIQGGDGDDASVAALRKVLAANGINRTWTWMGLMLQDPDFDGVDRQMPDLGLTSTQAEAARTELFTALGLSRDPNVIGRALNVLIVQWKAALAGALIGAFLLLASLMIGEFLWQRRKVRRQTARHSARHERAPADPKRTSA